MDMSNDINVLLSILSKASD